MKETKKLTTLKSRQETTWSPLSLRKVPYEGEDEYDLENFGSRDLSISPLINPLNNGLTRETGEIPPVCLLLLDS